MFSYYQTRCREVGRKQILRYTFNTLLRPFGPVSSPERDLDFNEKTGMTGLSVLKYILVLLSSNLATSSS